MKRFFAVLSFMALVFGVVAVAQAAPVERVPVCHFAADAGTFSLLQVAPQSLPAHLAHGDGVPGGEVPGSSGALVFDDTCAQVAAEPLLAVAYSNVDGVPGYDPSSDVLIAKLVDDGNGSASVGDTLVTSKYPRTVRDPANDFAFASFLNTTHVIDTVVGSGAVSLTVRSGGDSFNFTNTGGLESYDETAAIGSSAWSDSSGDTPFDYLSVSVASPSLPETSAYSSANAAGDDPFLDVDIFT